MVITFGLAIIAMNTMYMRAKENKMNGCWRKEGREEEEENIITRKEKRVGKKKEWQEGGTKGEIEERLHFFCKTYVNMLLIISGRSHPFMFRKHVR